MNERAHIPRRERLILTAILVSFALLGIAYSVTVPVFEASDELWHYPMVEVIARTWRLPVQPLEPGASSGPWRQEGSQPPLYYAIGAALTFWIDTSDMEGVRQPNPHARAGEITLERDNVNLVIHDWEAERFPWSGTLLAVHTVRLFSVALGTWAVFLTWTLAKELWPDRPVVALAAAAIHAFTPMSLFVNSAINNDNLIVPLSTLTLLLLVRRVKQAGRSPDRGVLWSTVGLGTVIGLALLTKASGIALLILAAAALAWEAWRLPDATWARRAGYLLSHAAAMLAPAALIAGWWFVRNVQLYGDWLGFNAFYAVLGTRDVPASLAQLWAERFAFAAGYWGNFGGLNVPMPDRVYTVLNACAIVAAAGLVVRFVAWLLRRRDGELRQKLWPFAWPNATAARALGWAFPAGVFVSWMQWATTTWSSQGRLIFTAIAMLSAALVLGLGGWLPRRADRYRELPGAILAIGLLGLCVVALPAWIVPAYTPPQALADDVSSDLLPLDVRFGNDLELVGFVLEPDAVTPGESVALRLRWRALGPAPSYRSIFIHLLGDGERIVAQRDTFPGHGLLPSTKLAAGTTWEERHLLTIPPVAYTPDGLTVAVGVYETATGSRLPATGDSSGSDDTTRFGVVALNPPAEGTPRAVAFGDGILLTGYALSDVVVARGAEITVTLDWLCTAPIDGDYTVSVQLIDAQWRKAGQSDAWPLDGQAPTSTWQVGQQITERRVLAIAPDVEPSAYDLLLSIYRPGPDGSLVHLPVSLGDAGMPSKTIVLTAVRVQ